MASFFWPGSEVWRRHPDIFIPYKASLNFLERCEEVVGWFQKFEMDFATLYFNEPDHTGHDFGPNSPEYMQKVKTKRNISYKRKYFQARIINVIINLKLDKRS